MKKIQPYLIFVSFSLITFIIAIGVYFNDVKNDMTNRFIFDTNRSMEYIEFSIKENVLNNDYARINSIIEKATKIDNFEKIDLKYKRFVFTADALFNNNKSIEQKGWAISDVTVDIKDGEITQLNDKYFEFIPSKTFKLQNKLNVKLQIMKDGDVVNQVSSLDYFASSQRDANATLSPMASVVSLIIPLHFEGVNKNIIVDDLHLATLHFEINQTKLSEKIGEFFFKLVIFVSVLLFLMVIFLMMYKKYFFGKDMREALQSFEMVVKDMLENRFKKLENKEYKLDELNGLSTGINHLSKRVSSLVSELNVNRGMIERKIATDDLTGLHNQKVFESDIKNMFITSSKGYIAVLKLEGLSTFVQKSGSVIGNHLIEDFAHSVLNCIYEISKTDITLYRFYGSEFAIIAKNSSYNTMNELCKNIVVKLSLISKKYTIDESIVHIGATPFEEFGTFESIMQHAQIAYNKALSAGKDTFHIVAVDELEEKTQMLERSVSMIIENKFVELEYVYDTFLMYDMKTLIMQEAATILLDEMNQKIAIGTFISVAEKLHLAERFDKLVVEKVIKHLKDNEIAYDVAINLSVQSISNDEFISWLEGQLIFNNDIAKQLVFSITSYSAKANFEVFTKFVSEAHRFGSKVILKRFSYSDMKLDDLKDLKLDYIRIQKDYTTGISSDREKKHIVKNIIAFGELNEVMILGDSVKSDDDFNTLDLLGLYGTSK